MGQLTGKIAVVTGGGSGIGLAIAQRYADDGARVVLVGRTQARLDDAVATIGEAATARALDVGDEAAVSDLFASLDRVDLLVTCAGGAHFGPVDTTPPAAWVELFRGRFFGQLYACHYAVPKMPSGSAIILCSGIAADAHVPQYSGGSALCGAVNAMGKNLAIELAPRGIRVNVLSPGLIEGTAITPNLEGDELASFWVDALDRIPVHRAGVASDTADAAHYLATAPYVTGQVLDVDGGWTAT